MESSLLGERFLWRAGEVSGARWLPRPIRELERLPRGLLVLRLWSSGLWLFLMGLKYLGSSSYCGGYALTANGCCYC